MARDKGVKSEEKAETKKGGPPGKPKAEAKAAPPKAEARAAPAKPAVKPAPSKTPEKAAAKPVPTPAESAGEPAKAPAKPAAKVAKPSKTEAAKSVAAKSADDDDDEDEREPLLFPQDIDTSQDPETAAPAPLRAPRGDARSFRRAAEFCFIYRHKQFLVRRQGKVGKLGEWSVMEYPSKGAAAHAYAETCSDLTSDGFADFRG